MSIVIRAVIAAGVSVVAATGAILAAEQVMPAVMQPQSVSQPQAGVPAPAEMSVFDRFVGVGDLTDAAGLASQACGYSGSLQPGGALFWLGEPPETFSVNLARPGELPAVFRFSAGADALHAFASDGELYLQTGHRNPIGFEGRVWTLNEAGEPDFSGPVQTRARIAVACDDAGRAASLLNAAFARSGVPTDPVRAGVRAFMIGDGDDEARLPRLDDFIAACTPAPVIEELPAGRQFVLDAVYDEEARYGEAMGEHMSGERRAGTARPMVHVTLAAVDAGGGLARLETLRIPFGWHVVLPDDGRVSVVYRADDLEVISHTVEADGSRTLGVSSGPVQSASMPCVNPEAAAAILDQLNFGPRPAPLEMPG